MKSVPLVSPPSSEHRQNAGYCKRGEGQAREEPPPRVRGSLLSHARSAGVAGCYAVALSFLFLCFFGTFQMCLMMLGLRQRFDAALDCVGTKLWALGDWLPTALATVSLQQFLSKRLVGFGFQAWPGDESGPEPLAISEPSAAVQARLAERLGQAPQPDEGLWPMVPSAFVTLVTCVLQRQIMEMLKPASAKLATLLYN